MPIDIAVGLALSKNALDIVMAVRKAIREKKKLTDEEMRDYLETLQGKLVDVRTALMEADEDNRKLKADLTEAKRMAEFGNSFKLEEGVYWHQGYPYCPNCWDVNRTPMRLGGPTPDLMNYSKAYWKCPIHKVDISLIIR